MCSWTDQRLLPLTSEDLGCCGDPPFLRQHFLFGRSVGSLVHNGERDAAANLIPTLMRNEHPPDGGERLLVYVTCANRPMQLLA